MRSRVLHRVPRRVPSLHQAACLCTLKTCGDSNVTATAVQTGEFISAASISLLWIQRTTGFNLLPWKKANRSERLTLDTVPTNNYPPRTIKTCYDDLACKIVWTRKPWPPFLMGRTIQIIHAVACGYSPRSRCYMCMCTFWGRIYLNPSESPCQCVRFLVPLCGRSVASGTAARTNKRQIDTDDRQWGFWPVCYLLSSHN